MVIYIFMLMFFSLEFKKLVDGDKRLVLENSFLWDLRNLIIKSVIFNILFSAYLIMSL